MEPVTQRIGSLLRGAARSTIRVALALLVLYALMHLAVGGVLHVFNAIDAIAPGVGESAIAASGVTDSDRPYRVRAAYANEAKAKTVPPAEDSRECRIGFPLDSNCPFE